MKRILTNVIKNKWENWQETHLPNKLQDVANIESRDRRVSFLFPITHGNMAKSTNVGSHCQWLHTLLDARFTVQMEYVEFQGQTLRLVIPLKWLPTISFPR